MNELGCIKVDVAMSDSAYYAHAPHDSITLPMAPSDLQGVIDRVSRFGSHGYEIKDIQTSGVIDKLHFAEDENVSLRALNAMAECVKRNPDIDYDAVRDYCDNFDVPVDPLMVGNVIMQAEQMPFISYSIEIDNEHPTPVDLQRAYGLTLIDRASEELETCLVDNRLPDGAKASLAGVVELLANVPAEALGAKMESGGEVCLTPSGVFDRNAEGIDLMKFDLDELEQAAFEGDRDFAADRIVVSAESRKMAEAGIDISQQLTLPMDAGELQDALKAFADMEGVEPSDIVMCDYELHGRFSEYSWHDFGTDDPIADMNRFAQIVVDHPDLNVGELFYYNDDHEIYDIDDIIDVAEHFDERLAEQGREFNLDELGESKCDEAELVNYNADKSEGNALAGGER